jgi:hypothetical protein
MNWKHFMELYKKDLYDMWSRWVVKSEKRLRESELVDRIVIRGERYYNTYEERYAWEEDKYIDLIDDGYRVTSFKDFVYSAYKNSIP